MDESLTKREVRRSAIEHSPSRRLLITGGAGFIGSAVCRHFLAQGCAVCNVDKLTYAANLDNLQTFAGHPNYCFEHLDICLKQQLLDVFQRFQPDAVLHLAAESHVDRSIVSAANFIDTNIVGTVALLDVSLEYWIGKHRPAQFRFVHISTDEVYGDLPMDGSRFKEDTPYNPSSPYSASKAASDFMVSAWYRTYGLPVLTSNCSNNYGPHQNPEKLIPNMIIKALREQRLPVYGKGQNVRDWLHVGDHVLGLERLLSAGRPGRRYNFGGGNERANIDVVHSICQRLDAIHPLKAGSYADLIDFVADRPGHDLRYAVDASRAGRELGWRPRVDFEIGLRDTVDWYLANRWWWDRTPATR